MVYGIGAESYQVLSNTPSASDEQIRRDIGRTFPEMLDEESMEVLFRVLRAVSHRLEDIGYCQGMNFIAGVFMQVFGLQEALVYQCVVAILLRHGMNQYFGERFPKLRLTSLQFDCLVEAFFPDLSARFDTFNLSAEFYATHWFLTLFTYSLPLPTVICVWDQFLCRGMKFIHRVGLALLQEALPELVDLDFDNTVRRLRNIGQLSRLSPEELVGSALEFKVTNRLLSELELAMTVGGASTGDGGARGLPVCFLERDLDSGRTKWRGAAAAISSASGAAQALPAGGAEAGFIGFLDGALPAPRIPLDPMAVSLETSSEATGGLPDEAGPAVSTKRRQRLKVLKAMPSAVRKKMRRPATGASAVGASGSFVASGASFESGGAQSFVQSSQSFTSGATEVSASSSKQDKAAGSSKRSSSLGKLVRSASASSISRVHKGRTDTPTNARDPFLTGDYNSAPMYASLPTSPGDDADLDPRIPESIPVHLRPFAVHNLDTGQWTVLGDDKVYASDPPSKASQKGRRRRFSPARRLGLGSAFRVGGLRAPRKGER